MGERLRFIREGKKLSQGTGAGKHPYRCKKSLARGLARVAGLLVVVAVLACAQNSTRAGSKGEIAMGFTLTTTAFQAGEMVPKKFTCDAADVSPALAWTDPPSGTQSFSLIVDDPDAPVGTWVHWVLYDLPASARTLPENVPKQNDLPSGARQGRNDFRKIGYGGPCPPAGPAHRYFFKLYALDAKTNLKAGATKTELEKAMQGHILAQAELMGRYRR